MVKQSRRKENGSKGLETKSPGLVRWGEYDRTGAPSSLLERETAGGPWQSTFFFEDDSRSGPVE